MLNVFNFTLNNVGDFYSPPFRYFDLGDEYLDIKANKLQTIQGKKLIVGGGALTSAVKKLKLNKTFKSNYVITWGIGGDKRVTQDEVLEFQENEDHFGNTWDSCDIISTRVDYSKFKYVPCASCMHKSFSIFKKIIPNKKIGIYFHWKRPFKINGITDHLSNQGFNIDEKLNFLSQFEIIITNAYHGLYWATLLGKKVLCIPNKSGLFSLKYKHTYFKKDSIINEELINNLKSYPDALEECREINNDFFHYIKNNS